MNLRLIANMLMLTCVVGRTSAAAAEPVDLKLNLKEAQVYRIERINTFDISQTMVEFPGEYTTQQKFDTYLSVEKVHANGHMDVRYHITGIVNAPLGEPFPTVNPDEDQYLPAPLSATLDPRGKMVQVEGIDQRLDQDMAEMIADGRVSEHQADMIRKQLVEPISSEQRLLIADLATLFLALPDKPVEPGESWIKMEDVGGEWAGWKTRHTFTLISVQDDIATIGSETSFVRDSEAIAPKGLPPLEHELSGGGEGVYHFDIRTGWLQKAQTEVEAEIHMKSVLTPEIMAEMEPAQLEMIQSRMQDMEVISTFDTKTTITTEPASREELETRQRANAAAKGAQTRSLAAREADSGMAEEQMSCPPTKRNICRNPDGDCVHVYTAEDEDVCTPFNRRKIEAVCGDADATLYSNNTACIDPQQSSACPASIEAIVEQDLTILYSCPDLHPGLCLEVCGPRYTETDVRDFWQTPPDHFGLVCLDASTEAVKNKVDYREDRARHGCFGTTADGRESEHHSAAGGRRSWCIQNHYEINGDVNLGHYVQCAGRMK